MIFAQAVHLFLCNTGIAEPTCYCWCWEEGCDCLRRAAVGHSSWADTESCVRIGVHTLSSIFLGNRCCTAVYKQRNSALVMWTYFSCLALICCLLPGQQYSRGTEDAAHCLAVHISSMRAGAGQLGRPTIWLLSGVKQYFLMLGVLPHFTCRYPVCSV